MGERLIRVCASLGLVAMLTLPSKAQGFLHVGGGGLVPGHPEELGDAYDTGWTIRGGAGVVISEGIEVHGGIFYSRLGIASDLDVNGAGLIVRGGALYGRIYVSRVGSLRPYILGGGGFVGVTVEDVSIDLADIRIEGQGGTLGSYTVEGGLGLALSTRSWVEPFIEATALHLLDIGDDIVFFPIRAGVVFRSN